MEWVAIAVNIARDPSVHRMAGTLRVRVPEVVGLLALTFAEMSQHAPDGNVGEVPDSLLETWAGWHGKRGAFAEQFRANLCNHAGLVLAWEKYNGANIRRAKAAIERTRTWRERKENAYENANRTHNGTHTETVSVRTTVQNSTEQDKQTQQQPPPRTTAVVRVMTDDPRFAAAWAIYPPRTGGNPRKEAFAAWRARIRAGVPPDALHAGVERYRAFCEAKGSIGTEYVMQARTFFGPSDRYLEPWTPPVVVARSGGVVVAAAGDDAAWDEALRVVARLCRREIDAEGFKQVPVSLRKALSAIGGWTAVRDLKQGDLPFRKRDFLAAYRAAEMAGAA